MSSLDLSFLEKMEVGVGVPQVEKKEKGKEK